MFDDRTYALTPWARVMIAALGMTVVVVSDADARGHGGGRSFGGGAGAGASRFADGRRHGNDAYVKAASDERDKLLKKLKDICRGC